MRTLLCLLTLWLAVPVLAQEPEPPEEEEDANLKLQVALTTGGHTAQVARLLFTRDSTQLVSVGRDRSIRYWDVETGELEKTLWLPVSLPHAGMGQTAALSPNGKLLAMSGAHGGDIRSVVLFNVARGLIERRIEIKGLKDHLITSLEFSPKGQRLAVGCVHKLVLLDLSSGKVVQQIPFKAGTFTALAFSPDGKHLAAAKGKGVHLVDLSFKGKFVSRFELDNDEPNYLLWSPNGKTLWVATDKGIEGWNPITKSRTGKTHAVGMVNFIQPTPSGQSWLLAGASPTGRSQLTSLDLKSGKTAHFPLQWVAAPYSHAVAISPDQKWLAAAGGRFSGINLWKRGDAESRRDLVGVGSPRTVVGWSPDGNVIAYGRLLNPAGKTYLERHPLPVPANAFDLRALAPVAERIDPTSFRRALLNSGGVTLRLEPLPPTLLQSGKELVVKTFRQFGANSGTLLPDGRAVIGGKRWILFADGKTGTVQRKLYHHHDTIQDMASSPNGKYLATASADQRLRLFDIATPGKEHLLLTIFTTGAGDWVVWTKSGYYAASPGGERMMGWILDNGPDKLRTFYPAERFRKILYRPDIIQLVLEKGNLEEAIKTANAERARQGVAVRGLKADVEDLLPPKCSLKILTQDGPKVTVQVSAEGQAKGQPIVALRVLLDGRPLADGAGVKEFEPGQAKAEEPFTLTVPGGKHTLGALARSEDSSAVSEPITVENAVAAQQPVLHLLAIGVDDYQNGIPKLNCAANDARDLAKAFPQVKPGQLFRAVTAQTLLNQAATTTAIRQKLAELRPQLKEEDVLVLFFAGHGVREGPDFYLLTAEADLKDLKKTALSGKELSKGLRDLRCQVLLLLDACHSGAVVKNLRPATDDAARALADDEVGVTVLAAAMGHEKALEQGGNGYFTAALMDALAGAKEVPINRRDGRMYVHHLYSYVLDVVSDRSNQRQHPFFTPPSSAVPYPLRQFNKK